MACAERALLPFPFDGARDAQTGSAQRQAIETAEARLLYLNSHVHALGDGAAWIVAQVDEQFGEQGSYLSVGTKAVSLHKQKAWMEALKAGGSANVLQALAPHRDAAGVKGDDASVRRYHRYLSSRRD